MLPHEALFDAFFRRRQIVGVNGSSNVSWIQYDQDRNVLQVGYLNLSIYVYGDVNPQEAASMLFAGSKGTWIWDNIRVRGKGNAHLTRKPFARIA